MSRTGEQILQAVSEVLNDVWSSTTTSAGASDGTSLLDTKLSAFGDNRLQGRYARLGATGRVVRRASRSTQSSGTLTFPEAFSAQVGSSATYQLHRYDPALKFKAIDKARLEQDVMESAYRVIVDDTITSDGIATSYDIPSLIEQGPHVAYVEKPLAAANLTWNFLSEPEGRSLTKWTATSLTASLYSQSFADLLIPKFNDKCVKLVVAASTNGTYKQVVADFDNDLTCALSAGREMTFARWVYCTAANRISLKVTDDAATTTGTLHQGKGWELIFVERTIVATNATTLTVTLDVTSAAAAVTAFAERAWFYYGEKERVCDSIYGATSQIRLRTDDTNRHILFEAAPPRGYQIRIQGKAPLTVLGTDLDTQATNSMEVDIKSQEILAIKAAEIVLGWGALTSDDVTAVEQRRAAVERRMSSLKREWGNNGVRHVLQGPYDA